MAIEINGKVYRNLEEQVQKNKEDIKELGGGSELTLHERVAKLEEDVEALTSLVNAIKEKTDLIEIEENSVKLNLESYQSFTVMLETGDMALSLGGNLEVGGEIYAPHGISVDDRVTVGDNTLSVINVEDATKVLGN